MNEPTEGTIGSDTDAPEEDDLERHAQAATVRYAEVSALYEEYAEAVRNVLRVSLDHAKIHVHTIEARGKATTSFRIKASQPSADDLTKPKYTDPLRDITDLAAARVITFFLATVDDVDRVVSEQFDVLERSNKTELLEQEEKLGYQSVHYLVSLTSARRQLPEYTRYTGLVAELQVRTILQHAWAEIEHEIQYKSVSTLPLAIRRRFLSLAGVIEIADREFQAIETQHKEVRDNARSLIQLGRLEDVEVTPDSLKIYLDIRFTPDGRMSPYSYAWTAKILRGLGFETIDQLEKCIAEYDDDRVSRAVWGNRQGQLQRLDDVLVASMGLNYREGHPWSGTDWFSERLDWKLERLRNAEIEIGNCNPRPK